MNKLWVFMRAAAMASLLLAWGGRSFAQIDHSIDNEQMNSGENRDAQDKRFAKSALEGSMAEVQLGQLALQKSSNAKVKQFAQRMVTDHTEMDNQLSPIAQRLGVAAPSKLDKKDQSILNKLSALSGAEFDQAYVKDMVRDHKEDLYDFRAEVSDGQDGALMGIAKDGGEIINQHLQMAEQLAKDPSVSGK